MKEKKLPDSIINFMEKWPAHKIRAEEIRKQYDDTFTEIDDFMSGNQWSKAAKTKPWMATPIDNRLHKIKNLKLSMISETELSIQMKPLAKADAAAADNLSTILQSYYDHADFALPLMEAKSISRSQPIGYFKLKFDGSKLPGTYQNIQKGDFVGQAIPPSKVYWDGNATNDDELEYIYQVHTLTLEQLENTAGYNQKVVQDILARADEMEGGPNQDNGDILSREYAFTQKGKAITVFEISYRWKPSPSANYKYGEIHTALQSIPEDTPGSRKEMITTPLFFKEDLGISNHFIIPLREYKRDGEFIGRSTVQLILDSVKELNKVDSVISNVANQLQNVMKIVSADSGINPSYLAKYGAAAGLVLVTKTDINNSFKSVQPVEIPRSLIDYRQEKINDINDVANVTGASTGQSSGSLNSSDGVNKLIMQAQSQEYEPMARYKDFLKRLINMMCDYLINNKTKVERRIDNKDPHANVTYSFKTFDFNDYKKLKFDTSVHIVMTEYEKQQQKQEVMQLMSLSAATQTQILSPEMIVKMFGFPDEEMILAKMHKDKIDAKNDNVHDIAQAAAMIMAQEIEQAGAEQGMENINIQQLAQQAAQEAVQRVQADSEGQQNGGQAASGSAAPQVKPQMIG